MLAQQRIFPRAVRAHGRILSRPSHIAWRSAAGSASEAHALPSSSLRDRMAPEELVEALDRHVVGQEDAKKALSIAIRSRWRRSCLEPEMRADTTPVNILMRGCAPRRFSPPATGTTCDLESSPCWSLTARFRWQADGDRQDRNRAPGRIALRRSLR